MLCTSDDILAIPVTGAYCIRNRVNGKRYVGGAYKSFDARKRHHWHLLNRGKHWNGHLQSAWKRYGNRNFAFEILERCPVDLVKECEQKWIDYYSSANQSRGYNLCPKADSRSGTKHSAGTRARLSAIGKTKTGTQNNFFGRKHSQNTLKKMSESHKGKVCSAEHRAKLAAASTGKKPRLGMKNSAESNARRSATQKGRDNSYMSRPEVRAKLSVAHKGVSLSAEHREAIVKKLRSSEVRAKISASCMRLSKEIRQWRSSTGTIGRMSKMTPEQRSEVGRKAAAGRWKHHYKEAI